MSRHLAPATAALALLVMGPVRASLELAHLPKEIAVAGLAAALLFTWSRSRFDRLDAALLAVAATALASAIFAGSPAFAWRPALLVLACVSLALTLRDRDDRALWLAWLGAAVTVLAVLGAIEGLGLAHWSPPGRAPSALLGQRNSLAHVLVLGSVVLCELQRTAAGRARIGWLLAAALAAAVVVMTRSRAAWLAAPVVLLAYRRLAPAAVALGGAAVALLLPIGLTWRSPRPYADTFARWFDASSGSGAGRLEQWSRSLATWPQHPLLGVGSGNAVLSLPRESNRFLTSDLVALGVERGALGALAVVAAAVLWLMAGRPRPEALAVAVGALVMGGLDAVTQLPAAALLVTVVLFTGLRRHSPQPRERVGSRAAGAVLAAGAVACTFAFASRCVSTAATTTFDDLELAVRLDPTDALTRLELLRAEVSARRCDDAREHAGVVGRQLPNHAGAREVLEAYAAFCR